MEKLRKLFTIQIQGRNDLVYSVGLGGCYALKDATIFPTKEKAQAVIDNFTGTDSEFDWIIVEIDVLFIKNYLSDIKNTFFINA